MKEYINKFFLDLTDKISMVSWEEIAKAIKIIHSVRENGGMIYLIGNGGSAAIASHFMNDLNKTVLGHKGDKKVKRFQAMALSDNVPMLTAWANDVGFESVFSEQLRNFATPKDVLIAISSSGKSKNIIKAVDVAKDLHLSVVGFVGFDGGELLSLSDAKIYIPSNNYGIVESGHDAITHFITNYFEEAIKDE
jgi:D-sedoheptulose 7-phosphate isomerase